MSVAAVSRRLEHDFSDRDPFALRRARAASVAHARADALGHEPARAAHLAGAAFRRGAALALEGPVRVGEPARAIFLGAVAAPQRGARFLPVGGQTAAAAEREHAGRP